MEQHGDFDVWKADILVHLPQYQLRQLREHAKKYLELVFR
jgi:hypothetical protein